MATAGLLLGGCGDDDAPSDVTATATGTTVAGTVEASVTASAVAVTPTATSGAPQAGEANTQEGRRAFAHAVDEALARGDVAFVTDRLRGAPDIAFSQFKQPASSMTVSQASQTLTRLLGATGRAERDSYGLAGAKVWWVGQDGSRPMLVVTSMSLDEAAGGYRRLGTLLQLKYCDTSCAAADRGRFVVTGMVLEWGDGFLRSSEAFDAAFGRVKEIYRRPLVLTPEIWSAARSVASQIGPEVKSIPDCTTDAACVDTIDAGVSVDLGVMHLGYQAARGEPGGVLVFAGRNATGGWEYWFATQNAYYQLFDLPGDVLVCADGDGLNIRERPDAVSPVVGFATDLTRLRAEEFVLTERGTFLGTSGAGWYRVRVPNSTTTGWAFSRFVTDARLNDCTQRDGAERASR